MTRFVTLALFFFTFSLPFAAAEQLGSYLATDRPAPLAYRKVPESPKALIKYLGEAPSRYTGEEVGRAATDGSRVFACSGSKAGVWRIQDTSGTLKLEGEVVVENEWHLSPNGKYLFGMAPFRKDVYGFFSLYRTDTWEPLWQLDRTKIRQAAGLAFSPDHSQVALLAICQPADVHVIVLETETGKTLHDYTFGSRMESDGVNSINTEEGNVIFTQDAILLAPQVDPEGRITRISLRDWKTGLVNVPSATLVEDLKEARRIVASQDGRWLAVHGLTAYALLERTGETFALRFEGQVEQPPDAYGAFCPLKCVAISPDSRQLVVSGGGHHKIFDIESRRLLHGDALSCRCGLFSQDGKTFWRTCAPLQPVDTATWEPPKSWNPHRHTYRIEGLAFSPDGKWLASCDEEHMYVWPVDGSEPAADCRSTRKVSRFQSPSWTKDGSRIIGSDGWDFLTWRFVSPVRQPSPVQINGEFSFGKSVGNSTKPVRMKIAGDATGTQFLVYEARDGGATSVRYAGRPGVVRHLKFPDEFNERSGDPGMAVISNDNKEVMISFRGLHAYGLAADTLRSNPDNTLGSIVAHDRTTNSTILTNGKRLNIVGDATLQQMGSIDPPAKVDFGFISNGRFTISADGHYLAFCGSRNDTGDEYFNSNDPCLILVDLKQLKVVAVQPQIWRGFSAAAFTLDSKKLALGHVNGLISLWDVEQLIADAPP